MDYSESLFPQPEPDPLDQLEPAGLALTYNDDRPELHDLTLGQADISDIRAIAGVDQPALPPQAADLWDTNAERHLLGWGVMSRVSSVDLQGLLEWWADAITLYGGASEQEFRQFAKGRFTAPQQQWLLGFYRDRLARQ
jgi:hypothetical protein